MSADDIAAEYARLEKLWSGWLKAVSALASETDPRRIRVQAAEVSQRMPAALGARIHMVELVPLEMRRRELEAAQRAAYVADLRELGLEVGTVTNPKRGR